MTIQSMSPLLSIYITTTRYYICGSGRSIGADIDYIMIPSIPSTSNFIQLAKCAFFKYCVANSAWGSFIHIIFIHTHFRTMKFGTYSILYRRAYTQKCYVNYNMLYSYNFELISLYYKSKSKHVSSSLLTCNRRGSNK